MQNYFKNLPPSTLVIIIETLVVLIVVGLILLYFLNKNGLVEVKKFIEVAWLKLMGFIFTPIVLVLGSTLGLWFLGPVEPHTFKSFLHELLIFLLIAGAVGAALHGKEFTKKFAELLYLSSNYLKDLSESNKKKFFANTLKKAYEFPKYGIEDEFATLTLDSWIPAFEEKYQSNHFIHRTIKPLEKGGKLEDGTLVYEKRGWRTHYPKNKAKASGYAIRVFKYKDFYELYKRLAFSSEVWMKKVPTRSKDNKTENYNTNGHTSCGKTKITVDNKVNEIGFVAAMNKIISLDFDTSEKTHEDIQPFFCGKSPKTGICVRVEKEDGKMERIERPIIEFASEKKILLKYKDGGVTYAEIQISINDKKIMFHTFALIEPVKAESNYHFVQHDSFYNYFREPFSLTVDCPTKGIIFDILFEGLNGNQKLTADVAYFAFSGANPMMGAIIGKNHYAAKFSGWFFVGHGVSFSYRIVDA